ncbi:hypothetical protein ACTMTI_41010 [Nonomuraea sp. H19]|uniref:hypothetical protein n=1 Tax=Nonomuraea sp. H19 TaxID=3452206 RepID=UPI003F8B1496
MTAAAPVSAADPDRAASMLLEAVRDAWFAGAPELARQAVESLHDLRPPPGHPLHPVIGAMTGLAALLAGDAARGLVLIHAVLAGAGRAETAAPGERLIVASMAFMVGDDEASMDLAASLVDDCRAQGMIGRLSPVTPVSITGSITCRAYSPGSPRSPATTRRAGSSPNVSAPTRPTTATCPAWPGESGRKACSTSDRAGWRRPWTSWRPA